MDARIMEMNFLAAVERQGNMQVEYPSHSPTRDMVVHLLVQSYLNAHNRTTFDWNSSNPAGSWRIIAARAETERDETLYRLVSKQSVTLAISHLGRVRLSELRAALTSGRDREPYGILWDARHVGRDLAVALTEVRQDAPLSFAVIDMNGLKQINDNGGHAKGNEAIRTLLEVAATVIGTEGQGYRTSSGDEVEIILGATPGEVAQKKLRQFMKLLGQEAVTVGGTRIPLSASCGLVTVIDPNVSPDNLRERADALMYKAKAKAKEATSSQGVRPSALAIEGGPEIPEVHPPN